MDVGEVQAHDKQDEQVQSEHGGDGDDQEGVTHYVCLGLSQQIDAIEPYAQNVERGKNAEDERQSEDGEQQAVEHVGE